MVYMDQKIYNEMGLVPFPISGLTREDPPVLIQKRVELDNLKLYGGPGPNWVGKI